MGKARRARSKYHHSSAAKSAGPQESAPPTASLLPPVDVPESLFAGLEIPEDALRQKLMLDFDAKSVISSRSVEVGKQLKKKEKRQIRHEVFLQKMEAVAQARKEAEARKRKKEKAKVNPVAHMDDLSEALPTLEAIEEETAQKRAKAKEKKPKKSTPKLRVRQHLMMQDITLFQQVLSHPVFKADPEGTITAHIHHQMITEAQDNDQT